jgi:hypothetical protein
VGALAYFGASLTWLAASRPLARSAFAAGSVHHISAEGASLAYRYLQERAGGVGILARPLGAHAVEARAVVFRLRPRARPSPAHDEIEEGDSGRSQGDGSKGGTKRTRKPPQWPQLLTRAEEEWVRGGGRLVLALAENLGPVQVDAPSGGQPPATDKVFPLWENVETLYPGSARVLGGDGLREAHAVFLLAGRPLLARRAVGRGEIFLLAAPEVLENGRLGQGDHLALLEALAEPGRPAYFDEHAHGMGSEPGLPDLLLELGFGPLMVLLLTLGVAIFWRERRRLGPAVEDEADARSDAVDLLDSLGQFYDRSLRKDEAAHLYRESLARAVALRTGLRGAALGARVAWFAGPPLRAPNRSAPDLSPAAFARTLKSINDAFRRFQA